MNNLYRTLFVVLLIAALLPGCVQDKTPPSEPTQSSDSAMLPDTDLLGATIYLYDRGEITAEIQAEKIIKFEKQDSTVAFDLFIDILDSLGQTSTTIVGDSGIIRESRKLLSIYGNVVVINVDSLKLETDFLYWNSRKGKIQTDAFVKITQGEDIMTGWGLEADENLFPFRILKNVSGTITDPERLGDNK
ncbi:MAG: LPS export ABC transporter periplasmic protein LptC [candidate division Zixibacteria bacterium]|nr:LPS export ABC transporter periplasmic protein LptC [candidate division Zixibacteria bacterium]